jgi:hypothetical protein
MPAARPATGENMKTQAAENQITLPSKGRYHGAANEHETHPLATLAPTMPAQASAQIKKLTRHAHQSLDLPIRPMMSFRRHPET